MSLDYLELFESSPILIEGVGHIHSPTIKEVKMLKQSKYNMYLGVLLWKFDDVVDALGIKEAYNSLSNDEKQEITLFSLIIANEELRALFKEVLSFFILGEVEFDINDKCYIVTQNGKTIGSINSQNFNAVRSYILQVNYIVVDNFETKKFKNERARALYEKIQKAKEEAAKVNKNSNEDMSIGNISSCVSAYHNSINPLNVGDLTVYQLYDSFFRLNYKTQHEIRAANYAYYGGEFNPSDWFKTLKK